MNPKKIGITIASALFVLIGGITGVQYLQDSPEESSSSDALTASGSETTVAATPRLPQPKPIRPPQRPKPRRFPCRQQHQHRRNLLRQ